MFTTYKVQLLKPCHTCSNEDSVFEDKLWSRAILDSSVQHLEKWEPPTERVVSQLL